MHKVRFCPTQKGQLCISFFIIIIYRFSEPKEQFPVINYGEGSNANQFPST